LPRINSSFTSRVRNPGRDTLLDYLARRFDYRTREQWAGLIAMGRLELEGRPASAGDALREGQRLRFAVVDYEEPEVPTDFRILPEEPPPEGCLPRAREDLLLVHKPAGMPVHRTGRIFFQTLANMLRERLGDPSWAPLNRLDRETSGIVAFARGAEALRTLAPSGPGSRWSKFYAAVVRGRPPGNGFGALDLPLGEKPGDPLRCRMHVFPKDSPPSPGATAPKEALTLYRILAERDGQSLVVLSPITGRKHQLRAHLAAAGCPVVGDKIYSGEGRAYLERLERELDEEDYRRLGARRHLLHAFHLRIEDADRRVAGAVDWDFGADFEAVFPHGLVRGWFDSSEGKAFAGAVDQAGTKIGPGEAGGAGA
jgi:23S rRNA pseudouridine1911/1915/1917 synthase